MPDRVHNPGAPGNATQHSPEAQHPQWVAGPDLIPGDAYMEGPYVVFTAQFHLRRGYCCNSDCRHCPYR